MTASARLFALWLAALLLTPWMAARAHTVPSLTIEAVFQADHSYTIRVNMDPRLFLSDQPATLPPVDAQWYREQTPEKLKETEKRAADYLHKALQLLFDAKPAEMPAIIFKPMDGATNQPLAADSKEVHLLAEMKGSTSAADSQVIVGKDANSSVILLNSFGDAAERRPQVLFPGETSRPFKLQAPAATK